jgi:hypothetical protein
MGIVLRGAFGEKLPRDTMTVRELLAWAQDAQKRDDQRRAEAERLAAAERARLAEIQAAMDSVLVVALVRKGYLGSDYSAGRYEDVITLSFAYQNKSARDIRAFEGSVTFMDLFGDTVYAANLKVDDPLKGGQTRREERSIKYNQFNDHQQKFRATDLENMKVSWQPKTVLFGDGQALTAKASE